MNALDELLAAGKISKMDYLLRRMQQAEEDAERIIAATPTASAARQELAYDQRMSNRTRLNKRYHD